MVEPSKIEEECRRRARINFENNKAWGRKGQEWALEAEHDWQAAETIASLQKELAERTKERDERPTAIAVEKALLSKLGREWTSDGISINSLIDELAGRLALQEQRDV